MNFSAFKLFMAIIHPSLAEVASSQAHPKPGKTEFDASEGVRGMVDA